TQRGAHGRLRRCAMDKDGARNEKLLTSKLGRGTHLASPMSQLIERPGLSRGSAATDIGDGASSRDSTARGARALEALPKGANYGRRSIVSRSSSVAEQRFRKP